MAYQKLGHSFVGGVCQRCHDSRTSVERSFNVCPGKPWPKPVASDETGIASAASTPPEVIYVGGNDDQIQCPKCGSTQLNADKKGFALGKAIGGGLLFGPVGLLGGVIGSGTIMITCLSCGKQWRAGALNR